MHNILYYSLVYNMQHQRHSEREPVQRLRALESLLLGRSLYISANPYVQYLIKTIFTVF